ncbi:hypothetical protein GF376_01420 [Candidatus Peregrinibacteria bacterium]|nr:hypothetical protein [Candidatus Peregrinibacteria bacterium]
MNHLNNFLLEDQNLGESIGVGEHLDHSEKFELDKDTEMLAIIANQISLSTDVMNAFTPREKSFRDGKLYNNLPF